MQDILKAKKGEKFCISAEGLQAMLRRPRDPQYPARHIAWTDDFRVELPIRKQESGVGAEEPITLIDEFRRVAREHGSKRALSVKRNNRWVTST